VECDLAALLGDSVLKTALLTSLGIGNGSDGGDMNTVGVITRRVSSRVSNQVLSTHAVTALVCQGVPLAAADLLYLPEHGRATCVEAAVALVYRSAGIDPVLVLARELLMAHSAPTDVNWKGLLLEHGGTVTSGPGGGGFVASARVHGMTATSEAWPSKKAAETAAAAAVMDIAGLATEEQRDAVKMKAATEAMAEAAFVAGAQVKAAWLQSAPDVHFVPATMPAASFTKASEGPSWFRDGVKQKGSRLQRMLGAHIALPGVVSAVYAWTAAVGKSTSPDESLHLGLMVVTLPDETQRWFVSSALQPSQTKAAEAVAVAAIHGLKLGEFAEAALRDHTVEVS